MHYNYNTLRDNLKSPIGLELAIKIVRRLDIPKDTKCDIAFAPKDEIIDYLLSPQIINEAIDIAKEIHRQWAMAFYVENGLDVHVG